MKTIAIFGGSKPLPTDTQTQLQNELETFFSNNKDSIQKIISGCETGSVYKILRNLTQEHNIKFETYMYTRHIEDVEQKRKVFDLVAEQEVAFYQDADTYVACPGWLWTLREILMTMEKLKEEELDKKVHICNSFTAFSSFVQNLVDNWMVAKEDADYIQLWLPNL